MKPITGTWLRFRIILLFGLFFCLFLIIFGRSYQLQVLQGAKLATLAERQYQRVVPLVPKRGTLYDRKREEMAVSMEMDSVFAQPAKVEDLNKAARKLAPILKKNPEVLARKMKEGKSFVWLERGIPPLAREEIEKLEIKGVDFLKEAKRFYPQGEVGAPVIGFAGLDSRGLEGVELGYDEFIRGEPGYVLTPKDALGRVFSLDPAGPHNSEEGCAVILTIDRQIQYVVERELKKAVQARSARGGMAVVMNPKTGEILAMAVQPSYNPNNFSTSHPQLRKNRTMTDTFEPGSTFKVFLLATALEEKAAAVNDMFFCENGVFSVGGKVIHDVHKYGWLTLGEVVKVSSNIGASKLGRKLGKAKLHRGLKNFGFGGKTGIDLPGEVSGFLPGPQHWSEIGLANISFGQGVSVTPLQLTAALAAIANGGVLMRPYVVQTVLDREGRVLKENHPREIRRVVSPETARAVAAVLKTATEEGGTGKTAALSGYETAGKTGTAQKAAVNGRGYSDKRVGSFIGFAPANDPRVVITVMIDEPKGMSYGGVVAAPVFKAVGEQVLPYLGVYPKGITYLAQGAPGPAALKSMGAQPVQALPAQAVVSEIQGEPGVMPDFSGKSIREVVKAAQRLGLEIKIEGSGRAVTQSPAPGEVLQGDHRGIVKFQPSI